MKFTRGVPFGQPSSHPLTTSTHPDLPARIDTDAEPFAATDMTLCRIETVINLLLLAKLSAAPLGTAPISFEDRLHAAMLSSALDEALAEARILWLELAPSVAARPSGQPRYRDVTLDG